MTGYGLPAVETSACRGGRDPADHAEYTDTGNRGHSRCPGGRHTAIEAYDDHPARAEHSRLRITELPSRAWPVATRHHCYCATPCAPTSASSRARFRAASGKAPDGGGQPGSCSARGPLLQPARQCRRRQRGLRTYATVSAIGSSYLVSGEGANREQPYSGQRQPPVVHNSGWWCFNTHQVNRPPCPPALGWLTAFRGEQPIHDHLRVA